jgi:hypothetical protein
VLLSGLDSTLVGKDALESAADRRLKTSTVACVLARI